MLTNLSGGKVVEGGCTTFFQDPPIYELEAEKLMGNSLGGEHSYDMLLFIVNLIVGLENHPPVQRCSSLPVLYVCH